MPQGGGKGQGLEMTPYSFVFQRLQIRTAQSRTSAPSRFWSFAKLQSYKLLRKNPYPPYMSIASPHVSLTCDARVMLLHDHSCIVNTNSSQTSFCVPFLLRVPLKRLCRCRCSRVNWTVERHGESDGCTSECPGDSSTICGGKLAVSSWQL